MGTKRDDGWTACRERLPPENAMVMTKIDDAEGVRNQQVLTFRKNLWWTGEGRKAVYVYYTPTHWKAWEPNPRID